MRPAASDSSSSRGSNTTRGLRFAGSRRASGRKARRTRDAAPWRLADADARGRRAICKVEACVPGRGPKVDVLRARRRRGGPARARIRRRRPHRPEQRAQPPDGSAGAAAHSRSQRRAPRDPRRAAPAVGLDGRDRHQSELRGHRARDGARAAPRVRHPPRARDDDAGRVGRGVSGRAVARHPRQRHSVHRRRRRGEDRERDASRFSAATAAARRIRRSSARRSIACR